MRALDNVDPGLGLLSQFWLASGDAHRKSTDPHPDSDAEKDHLGRIGRESPAFVASGKLMSAYDGARAAAILWREGEVHIIADYALLRVVTESAVVAWWIVSAAEPDERARRAFRVVMDDLVQARERETSAVKNAATARGRATRGAALQRIESELERVRTEMRTSQITVSEKKLAGERLSLRSLLLDAERTIPGTQDLEFTLLWAITSTNAHGSLTAVEQMTTPVLRRGGPTAFSSPDSVFAFASSAANLLRAAHLAWDRYAGY